MKRELILEILAEGFGTDLYIEKNESGIRFVEIPSSSFSAEEMDMSEEEYQRRYKHRYYSSFMEFWTKFAKHDWFYLTYYCSDSDIKRFIHDEMKKAIQNIDLHNFRNQIVDERRKARMKVIFIRDHVRDGRPQPILKKMGVGI